MHRLHKMKGRLFFFILILSLIYFVAISTYILTINFLNTYNKCLNTTIGINSLLANRIEHNHSCYGTKPIGHQLRETSGHINILKWTNSVFTSDSIQYVLSASECDTR